MGRTKLFKNAEELQNAIDNYFKKCDKNNKPYTVCGLALELGVDRKTLINYSKEDEFFHTIKNAKLKIESQLEESLYRLGNNSGVIFNLKNNYGWKDNAEDEDEKENRNGIINELVEALENVKKN